MAVVIQASKEREVTLSTSCQLIGYGTIHLNSTWSLPDRAGWNAILDGMANDELCDTYLKSLDTKASLLDENGDEMVGSARGAFLLDRFPEVFNALATAFIQQYHSKQKRKRGN